MRHDPASGAVVIMLRSLKMFGMAQAVEELVEQGAPAFEAAVPILSQLLKAEVAEREVRSIAYHMKAARFPAYKDLAGFDFTASEINEALVRQLHRCEFIDGAHNVVLIGGPGTGKTHVATAFGVQAVEHHRKKVRFFSTVELVNTLEQEKARGKAGQLAESLTRTDLVILEELGYLPFSATGGALLFHLLSKLYERTSVAITTNLSFSACRGLLTAPLSGVGSKASWPLTGHGLRRRQDDHRAPRSSHPSLPHPGDRKRQLSLQGQRRGGTQEEGGTTSIDPDLSR
jgi:DNA replication protein DnaC